MGPQQGPRLTTAPAPHLEESGTRTSSRHPSSPLWNSLSAQVPGAAGRGLGAGDGGDWGVDGRALGSLATSAPGEREEGRGREGKAVGWGGRWDPG